MVVHKISAIRLSARWRIGRTLPLPTWVFVRVDSHLKNADAHYIGLLEFWMRHKRQWASRRGWMLGRRFMYRSRDAWRPVMSGRLEPISKKIRYVVDYKFAYLKGWPSSMERCDTGYRFTVRSPVQSLLAACFFLKIKWLWLLISLLFTNLCTKNLTLPLRNL